MSDNQQCLVAALKFSHHGTPCVYKWSPALRIVKRCIALDSSTTHEDVRAQRYEKRYQSDIMQSEEVANQAKRHL